VFDALLRALEDPDFGVARATERSLGVITGHAGGDDPGAWQQFASERGADLFANAQAYTFRRYDGRKGLRSPGPWASVLIASLPPYSCTNKRAWLSRRSRR